MATWYVTFDDHCAIEHHGIKGQKWGVRRFQNEDGTLTELGRQRYSDYKEHQQEKYNKAQAKYEKAKASGNSRAADQLAGRSRRATAIADMGRTVGITGMGAAAGAGLWARLKDREDRGKHRRR